MSSMNPYLQRFQELEVIGRGNFGSATLVKEYASGQVYIAKKIVLAGLKEKEQESSKQEAELLKNLNHPNIVAYKDSFMIDGTLIIIMEFCEEGDLAFHIKRKKNKKERLPEAVILNWFTQIAAALNYIHQHKILHRDIKTSNIFLNSNGDIKIGDFGISRVLENTHDSAQTVVGTPYYMSPEVCESKPYTQKSDVWALGCVVYELCTLEHAFNSNNLLGLVYKIVKDQAEEIPNIYSEDLKNIIKKMLEKDDVARPTIAQILQEPFLLKAAQEYIESNGQNIKQSDIPIKMTYTLKTQINGQEPSQDPELGETFQSMAQSNGNQTNFNNNNSQNAFTIGNTIMSMQQTQQQQQQQQYPNYNNTLGSTVMSNNSQTMNNTSSLTAKQISEQKKRERADAAILALNQATREQAQTLNYAKTRKQEDWYHHTNSNSNNKTYSGNQASRQQVDQFNQNQIMQAAQIQQMTYQQNNYFNNNNNNNNPNAYPQQQFNNQNVNTNNYPGMNDLTNQMGGLTITQGTNDQYYNQPMQYSNYQQQQMYNVPQQQYGQMQFNTPYPQQQQQQLNNNNNGNDEFNNTEFQQYQNQQFEEYNSDDDEDDKKEQTFTLTGTYSNRLTLKASNSQKQGVLNVYKDLLNQKPKQAGLEEIMEQQGESGLMTPQKTSKQPSVVKGEQQLPVSQQQSKIEKIRQECIQALPEPLFTKAYEFIKSHEMNPQTQKELQEIVGKQNASKCFKIEELVFYESSK